MGKSQGLIYYEVCRRIFKEYAQANGYKGVESLGQDRKLCWFFVGNDGSRKDQIDVTTVPMKTDGDGFVFVEALQTKVALATIREYLSRQCKVSFA